MEPKFKTSFVPKSPVSAQLAKSVRRRRGSAVGIFTLLTLLIFLAAIALSVGVFLYQQFLSQSLTEKSESLERARAAFEPALLQEIARLDRRVSVANTLLSNHLAPSALFSLLERETLQGVRFKDFNFSVTGDTRIGISMRGEARSFSAIVLQSDAFIETRMIREPLFSDLTLNRQGNVVFNFSGVVDPSLVSYERTVDTRGTSAPTETQQQPEAVEPVDETTPAS